MVKFVCGDKEDEVIRLHLDKDNSGNVVVSARFGNGDKYNLIEFTPDGTFCRCAYVDSDVPGLKLDGKGRIVETPE